MIQDGNYVVTDGHCDNRKMCNHFQAERKMQSIFWIEISTIAIAIHDDSRWELCCDGHCDNRKMCIHFQDERKMQSIFWIEIQQHQSRFMTHLCDTEVSDDVSAIDTNATFMICSYYFDYS